LFIAATIIALAISLALAERCAAGAETEHKEYGNDGIAIHVGSIHLGSCTLAAQSRGRRSNVIRFKSRLRALAYHAPYRLKANGETTTDCRRFAARQKLPQPKPAIICDIQTINMQHLRFKARKKPCNLPHRRRQRVCQINGIRPVAYENTSDRRQR
jgi:hypothetical protein